MSIPDRLNPNYRPVPNFIDLAKADEGKLNRLALDIGNCVLKVKAKPGKHLLRRLRKFFVKTTWFKKVRIIRNRLFLFRRRGRFAIVLSHAGIYNLKTLARTAKQQACY